MVSLSNHERLAQDVLVEPRAVGRPSAFAEATADRRSAKREGWSTSSGRAVRQFNCSPGLKDKASLRRWRSRLARTMQFAICLDEELAERKGRSHHRRIDGDWSCLSARVGRSGC